MTLHPPADDCEMPAMNDTTPKAQQQAEVRDLASRFVVEYNGFPSVEDGFIAGWEAAKRSASQAPEPHEIEPIECSDCGKPVVSPHQIVIKNNVAMHKNCPAAERHGKLG